MEDLFTRKQLLEMVASAEWDIYRTGKLGFNGLKKMVSLGTTRKNKQELIELIKELENIRYKLTDNTHLIK